MHPFRTSVRRVLAPRLHGLRRHAELPLRDFAAAPTSTSPAGPTAVIRHSDARIRGYKRVHVEPHLTITGACSAEWVPIRPKTDPGLPVRPDPRAGLRARPRATRRSFPARPHRLALSGRARRAVPARSGKRQAAGLGRGVRPGGRLRCAGRRPAVAGRYRVASAVIVDADAARRNSRTSRAPPPIRRWSITSPTIRPNGRQTICDVPAATIRRIAGEYLEAASIGATIEIDGQTLPLRPVAVTLGKSVNNGWGAYECCWARTVLAALVGALENPGGMLGTTVRLNRPQDNRHLSVKPGEDGFMVQYFNPTGANSGSGADDAQPAPDAGADRRPQRRLEPGAGPDAACLAVPEKRRPTGTCRSRPIRNCGSSIAPIRRSRSGRRAGSPTSIAHFPYMVAFAYTVDETNYMADLLGRIHTWPPARASSSVVPIEWPTPATNIPAGAKASSAWRSLRARSSKSRSVTFGD